MRDLDSYLAGVFDGEGYITVQWKENYHKRKYYSRLLVGLGMNVPTIPEMFKSRFGGNVKCYHQKKGPDMYPWYALADNAINALEVLSKLLVLKQEQAELALEFARLMRAQRIGGKRHLGSTILSEEEMARRHELAIRIKELKSAGTTRLHADA